MATSRIRRFNDADPSDRIDFTARACLESRLTLNKRSIEDVVDDIGPDDGIDVVGEDHGGLSPACTDDLVDN